MSLKVKDLRVLYSDTLVLDDICLNVEEGEFISIVGESGCGKTTLLNAIAGFIDYSGEVLKPEKFGIIFQSDAVFPWMSVENNIRFGQKDESIGIEHYLDVAGLTEKRSGYPYELSGGQVQRVALARTLAAEPELILMDEPYGALDVYTRERMQEWLLDVWKKEGKTVVFVTHSIDEAVYLSDRVVVLKERGIHGGYRITLDRPRHAEIKFDRKFIELKKRIAQSIKNKSR